MKKIILLSLVLLGAFALVGCKGGDDSTDGPVNLKLNISMGNTARTLTYNHDDKMVMPNGDEIVSGDLKPTWQYIEDKVGITIEDVASQSEKATDMIATQAATSFDEADIFGGNSIAEDLMSYGTQGLLVNLNDHMDAMPELKAYLDANESIKTSITAADGGIYHIPYVAEVDNYARTLLARQSWVTTLLDGGAVEAETKTISTEYQGYWSATDRDVATNVITLQNTAAAGDGLSFDEARTALLNYISAEYDLAKPSDLYLGETAVYDMDELIALWRVISLAPNTLSKLETGTANPEATIVPFFTRQGSYREDLLRLSVYWGGQRVHGSDSYGSRFYLDSAGQLNFSYAEDDFLNNLDYFKQLYNEGLIYEDFNETSEKGFRDDLFSSDDVEGNRAFGFMTLDWIASTTKANADVSSVLPPLTTIESSDGEFVHYIENTRAIKPDGWAISKKTTGAELDAALKLFNYIFTEEGARAQVYGPEGLTKDGKTYEGPDGEMYPEFDTWVIDTAGTMKNGDISGFLRDYVGSLISIGFQKEIGFEYQYTVNNGPDSWALYQGMGANDAVITPSYGATDTSLRLVPPVFALTEQQQAQLATITLGEDQTDLIFQYITGTLEDGSTISQGSDIKAVYEAAGLNTYVTVYRDAYSAMTE